MEFQLDFFVNENGERPAYDFILQLPCELRVKVIGHLAVLRSKGPKVREPLSKPLGDGLFELRCRLGSDSVRLLYFFHKGRIIIVTNGFMKKTQKTPRSELKLAKKRREEYLEREDNHGHA